MDWVSAVAGEEGMTKLEGSEIVCPLWPPVRFHPGHYKKFRDSSQSYGFGCLSSALGLQGVNLSSPSLSFMMEISSDLVELFQLLIQKD